MPITVELPGGKTAEFPDGTDHSVMEKALQDLHGADSQMENEDRWHKVRLALEAPVKGAASLGTLMVDAMSAPVKRLAWPENLAGPMPKELEGMPMTRELMALGDQPQTSGEKYMESALQGVGGGILGSTKNLVKNAVTGGMSGLGGEAAGNATDDSATGRIAGALGTAIGTTKGINMMKRGLGRAVKPNVAALARETLKDVPEEDLADAVQRMGTWRKEGFAGTAAQAVDVSPELEKLQDLLAQHTSGTQTQKVLRQQPEDVINAGTQAVARIGGNVQSVPAVANAVQEAATTAVENARGEASKAWRQMAGNAPEVVPQEASAALDRELSQLAKKYPNTSAADMINDARSALKNPNAKPAAGPGIVDQFGRPVAEQAPKYLDNALQIKEALEDRMSTFGSRELNTTGTDAKMLRRAMEVREAVSRVLEEHAPNLKAADAAYNTVMQDSVDPLKQSAVGQLAGRRGYQEDAQAPVAKLNALFDKGTVNPKASDILYVSGVLNKQDPTVFPNAVATWVADKIAHLPVRESEKQFSPETAKAVRSALFGSPAKAQGLRDMLAGAADAQGVPREQLVRGFERYMDIVDAAAKRPYEVGGVTKGELTNIAGKSKAAESLRLVSYFAPSHVATGYAGFTTRRVLADVDKMFTTPEGLETLANLAKTPPGSQLAADILVNFRAATASSQQEEEQQ